VEVARIELASEAESPEISTSVSREFDLAWRLPPDGIRFSQPRWMSRPRAAAPLERQSGLCDAVPRSAGIDRDDTRDLSPGAYVSTCLRSEGESVGLVGICKNACAVTRAPSARNPEAQLPRRSQTPHEDELGCTLNSYPSAAASTLDAPMAVNLDRIGRASLKELGDIRIDDVLSFIDRASRTCRAT